MATLETMGTGGHRQGTAETLGTLATVDTFDASGCRQSLQSRQCPRLASPPTSTKIILPHGGYKKLLTYQKSDLIYQGTVVFCRRFLPARGDRTVDQMVQAARSCKQNIVEGSEASAASKETELKLTNVAKASLEELLEDYLDYLKTRHRALWDKDSVKGQAARRLGRQNDIAVWEPYFEKKPDEVVANLMVSLIRQCTYLLAKQIKQLEDDFKNYGGIRERMHAARVEARGAAWETALADYLGGSSDAAEFAERGRSAQAALRRIAWRIKKGKGW